MGIVNSQVNLFQSGALAYAEIGTIITGSGGEYAYYLETFAPPVDENQESKLRPKRGAFYRQIPAFLYQYMQNYLLTSSSQAILCLTFAEYFAKFFRLECTFYDSPQISIKLLAIACVCEYLWCYFVTLMNNSVTPPNCC